MDDKNNLIRKILVRNRDTNLLYSSLVTLSGCFLAVNPWQLSGVGYIVLVLAAIAMFGAGLTVLIRTLQNWKVDEQEIMKLIHETPGEVVWVYHHILESMPFGVKTMEFTTVYIHLIDKKSVQFRIKKQETDEILDCLKTHFHRATFGHSLKKEQLYRANPELLLRGIEIDEE